MNLSDEAIANTTIDNLALSIADVALSEEDRRIKMQLREKCTEFLRLRLRDLADADAS